MKRIWLFILVCTINVFFFTTAAWSAEFCVNPEGSGESDLETALATAAANGVDDTIKVAQGMYTVNLYYYAAAAQDISIEGGYVLGTNCTERVVNPENTILDGSGETTHVVSITTYNGGSIQIDGFTIQNASSTEGSGAGINAAANSTSGTAGNILISNNIVKNNTSINFQCGGIFAKSFSLSGSPGTVTLINNIIANNNAVSGQGAGIFTASSSNTLSGETVILMNNTITGNTAAANGGGIFIEADSNAIYFYNNIIWGNTAAGLGDDIYLGGIGTTYGYNNNYSQLEGIWNGGSDDNIIGSNPKLSASYHLNHGSPCIDKGNNSPPGGLPSTDIDGDDRSIDGDEDSTVTVDIGADEYFPKGVLSFFLLLFD